MNIRALAAVVRTRFAAQSRAKYLHLRRLAMATALAALAIAMLFGALSGRPADYRTMAQFASLYLGWPLGLVAWFTAVRSGCELAGSERQRGLDLLALTPLTPREHILALWFATLARIALACLVVVPALSALTLVGGADAAIMGLAALSLVNTVMVVAALGLAVGQGAKRPAGAAGRVLLTLLALISGAALAAALGGAAARDALLWLLPYLPTGPLTGVTQGLQYASPWLSFATSLATSLFLLWVAEARLRRRFSTAATGSPRLAMPAPRLRDHRAPGASALDWLAVEATRRHRRLMQLACLALTVTIVVVVLALAGWTAFKDEGFYILLMVLLGHLSLLLILAGPSIFWQRLRGRGLLPLLLTTPLEARDFLRASLRSALAYALPLVLPFLASATVYGLVYGSSAPRLMTALGAVVLALAVLAILATMGGMDPAVGKRSALGIRGDALALLTFGGPILLAVLEIGGELSRSLWADSHADMRQPFSPSRMTIAFPILALSLVAALVPIRHVRYRLLKPIFAFTLIWPTVFWLSSNSEGLPWLCNPVVVAFAGTVVAVQQGSEAPGWYLLRVLAAPVMLGMAVGLWLWLKARFDEVVGRAA